MAILYSFLIVALSEMGDKTQLLAFALATRFKKPWPIMAGILVATILNHALASAAGAWVSHFFRPDVLSYALGVSFVAFGFWTLKPDTFDASPEKEKYGPFLTTTVLFFLAEMGDKTQLATLALGAQYSSPVQVTLGTTAGMLAADGLAVFLGEELTKIVPLRWIRRIAAGLFFAFGVFAFWHGFTSR